ncbi:serine/arginine repetitive matrix protein 1-like isoform X2 [Scylla paramamosain]|uniref:serine/arginine repetitive matrix protein 1-like isoform X2 n=1 Tax=Scylla paramamosain TaxID=85552 RepID=UPI003082BB83
MAPPRVPQAGKGGTSFTVAFTAPTKRPGISTGGHKRPSRNPPQSRITPPRVTSVKKQSVGVNLKGPRQGERDGSRTENMAFDPGGGGAAAGAVGEEVPRRPRIRPAPPLPKPEPKIVKPKGKMTQKGFEPEDYTFFDRAFGELSQHYLQLKTRAQAELVASSSRSGQPGPQWHSRRAETQADSSAPQGSQVFRSRLSKSDSNKKYPESLSEEYRPSRSAPARVIRGRRVITESPATPQGSPAQHKKASGKKCLVSHKKPRPASLGPGVNKQAGSEQAPPLPIKRTTWDLNGTLSEELNKLSEDKDPAAPQISDKDSSEKPLERENNLWGFVKTNLLAEGAAGTASPVPESSGVPGVRGGKVQPSHNSSRLQDILYGRANESPRASPASQQQQQQQQRAHSPGVSVGGGMTSTKHMSLLERKKKQWEEERAFLNAGCGFWGRAQPTEPQRPTPPTDKPPDHHVKQQQMQQQPQQYQAPTQQQQIQQTYQPPNPYRHPQQQQQQEQVYQNGAAQSQPRTYQQAPHPYPPMSAPQQQHHQAYPAVTTQQLEEKKRQKAVEEERERREAAIWEERVREQQEREARELQEEIRKKKEKEEAEERRQQQLQTAIKEAAEKAKKEKSVHKYGHIRSLSSSASLPEVREEGDDQPPPHTSGCSTTPRRRHHTTHARPSPPPTPSPQRQRQQQLHEQTNPSESSTEQQESSLTHQEPSRPSTLKPQLSADADERTRLLRTLGIAPEMLLASSGLLDRSSLLSLLQAITGQQRLISNAPNDYAGDYVTDRIITPTKYRGPPSRDCGIQCDDSLPDRRTSPRRESRRRLSRKTASLPRDSGQSSDARPPWGHNQSDRPYRKQSEKDPYSNRRLRRRAARSLSRCERDTPSEESDPPQVHRRRRKTWDKSRQESLSSDISRSPSPRDRRRGSRPSVTTKQWPTIKPSLTPALHRPPTPEHRRSPVSPHFLAPPPETLGKEANEEGEHDPPSGSQSPLAENPVDSQPPPAVRSTSPPVPALMRKLTGQSSFDVPEYPPGTMPPFVDATSTEAPAAAANDDSTQDTNEASADAPSTEVASRPSSPPIPTVLKRMQSADSSLTLPELPQPPSRPTSRPPSANGLSPAKCLSAGGLTTTKGATLPGRGRAESARSARSSSQPPSPTSRPPTPRRLPPMIPSKSEEVVSMPGQENALRPSSPPVPALARRLSATSRIGQLPPDNSVDRQLTPVETPGSPRHQPAASSPASAATSGVSSRPGSATSGQEEDVRTVSVTSSGYESGRRSSGEPKSLSEPLVSPDKWVILKSLSSLRQNLWRRHQELSHHPDSDGSS